MSTTAPTSTTPSSTSITTLSSSPATTTPSASTTVATVTGSETSTPTLASGWYWIRGVETPYYHSYLQTLPTATPGTALLDSYETAGQYNIIDGQLVYNTGSGTTDAALYLHVEDPADKTQRALATWFDTTENTYGSFAFSGDTVTWTDPDVARPNTAAFYVCPGNSTTGENALFVNTGAYLYETPSGCYDVDVSHLRLFQCGAHGYWEASRILANSRKKRRYTLMVRQRPLCDGISGENIRTVGVFLPAT